MGSIVTLTLFRFTGLTSKLWALPQMRFAHAAMGNIAGLHFYKLMGSGRELGFSPFPDWGVYAMLCVWDHEQSANDFFNNAEIYQRYREKSSEQWTIFMKPIQTKGSWSGGNPFTPSADLDAANPLIAVITRATIRPHQLLKFWRYVPTSQRPIQRGCEGLIFTKGIGEAPLVQMATISIWETLESLKKFAYNSPEHIKAIQKTHQLNWYQEEMFARFQPFRSSGVWGGQDLLAAFLKY
jgi:heme-degrading monooxygenase HmoA